MKRYLPLLLLMPLFYAGSSSAEVASLLSPPAKSAKPVVLVHIQRLTGTGPDNREHVLYDDRQGVETTLDALGRVGYQVSAKGLAEGGYHTLFVELADHYQIIQPDGGKQEKSFSETGRKTRMRVRGMIMVRDGNATPLRMMEDPSYYGSMRSHYPERDDDD